MPLPLPGKQTIMLSTNIKEATRQAHQELEKKVIYTLKAIRSEQDYVQLLKYFYAYFSQLETMMAPYITTEVLPDYAQRRHASSLKKDIEALGAHASDLPEAVAPDIQNTLQAMGALYVMEGSIMGGSIIVQMLAKAGITTGVSFFSGYGEATGAMWGKFTAVLNNIAATNEDEETVIAAANDTFSCFSETFEEAKV